MLRFIRAHTHQPAGLQILEIQFFSTLRSHNSKSLSPTAKILVYLSSVRLKLYAYCVGKFTSADETYGSPNTVQQKSLNTQQMSTNVYLYSRLYPVKTCSRYYSVGSRDHRPIVNNRSNHVCVHMEDVRGAWIEWF